MSRNQGWSVEKSEVGSFIFVGRGEFGFREKLGKKGDDGFLLVS